MKSIVKICLFGLLCIFGACENEYETSETSSLRKKVEQLKQ